MQRQKSESSIRHGRPKETRDGKQLRSKTPVPTVRIPSSTSNRNEQISNKQNTKKPQKYGSTNTINMASSAQIASKPNASKQLTNETQMDAVYSKCLHIMSATQMLRVAREQKEQKMIDEIANMETNVVDVSEEVNKLTINIKKMEFLSQKREQLEKKIEDYNHILGNTNIDKLNSYIKQLEEDTSRVRLRNFILPQTENDSREIQKCLQEMEKQVEWLPMLEKTIGPFTQLESSLLQLKQNIEDEAERKLRCEKKLREVDELITDYCFSKGMELEEE